MNGYPDNIVLHVLGYTIPAHAAGLGKYPYDCISKHKHPNAMIYYSDQGGWTHSEDPACKRAISEAQSVAALCSPEIAAHFGLDKLASVAPHLVKIDLPNPPKLKTSAALRSQDFNESDCGGAFDGFQVTSDADPGL